MRKRKRIIPVLLVISIFLSLSANSFSVFAAGTTRPMSTSDPIVSNQSYYIYNVHSNKYMSTSTLTSGSRLFQYLLCISGERFVIKLATTVGSVKYYNILPESNQNLLVEVVNASNTNQAEIGLFQNNPPYASAQQFQFIDNGDGSYRIQPRLSSNRVIEVQSASTADHGIIQLYNYVGQDQQKWIIKRVKLETTNTANANSSYTSDSAVKYAKNHAKNPSLAYSDTGQNCTNFVSQCLSKGNLPMIPGTINSTTDTENNNNWFFKLLFPHTLSNSWSRAGDFYAHWGTAGGRTYKEVRYYTGFDALNDYSHILSTYTAGSSIIVGSHATTAHELFHSMFIYDSNVECDGKHKGVANTCVNNGTLNEFLYAQQGVANDKANQYYIMGHGVNLLIDYIDRYFVFLKYHQ